jgi:Predicted site-specific integrase-resolvase
MSKIKITSTGQLDISREDLLRQMKICFIQNRKWFKKYLQKDFEDEQLLTSSDVRKKLSISKTTLFRYVRDGKLVPIDLESRSYRFLKSEVNNLVKRKENDR